MCMLVHAHDSHEEVLGVRVRFVRLAKLTAWKSRKRLNESLHLCTGDQLVCVWILKFEALRGYLSFM